MPDWNEILDELGKRGGSHDIVRRERLQNLYDHTGRNVIAYYSGWLQKPEAKGLDIIDYDMTGFMTTVHDLDKSRGLDLILHTPGGGVEAAEAIVHYLCSVFGHDVRAIVPQLALSAGTMIACACKSIVMGKQSSLGPIDPAVGGVRAHALIEEFEQAQSEIKADQSSFLVWKPILDKYVPTLYGECQKAMQMSRQIVTDWLTGGMLSDQDGQSRATDIVAWLGNHAFTLSHARHLGPSECAEHGLIIERLEDDPILQDLVLTVHHSFTHTLSATAAVKIIENHEGKAFINTVQSVRIVPA